MYIRTVGLEPSPEVVVTPTLIWNWPWSSFGNDTYLNFSKPLLEGCSHIHKNHNRVLSVEDRIVSTLWWLMNESFWSFTFSWMIVYFHQNDFCFKIQGSYTFKRKIVYLFAKRSFTKVLGTYTFIFKVGNFANIPFHQHADSLT